jgi:hypothetical protein
VGAATELHRAPQDLGSTGFANHSLTPDDPSLPPLRLPYCHSPRLMHSFCMQHQVTCYASINSGEGPYLDTRFGRGDPFGSGGVPGPRLARRFDTPGGDPLVKPLVLGLVKAGGGTAT